MNRYEIIGLHYQPQMSLRANAEYIEKATGEKVSKDAIRRWRNERYNPIPAETESSDSDDNIGTGECDTGNGDYWPTDKIIYLLNRLEIGESQEANDMFLFLLFKTNPNDKHLVYQRVKEDIKDAMSKKFNVYQ